MSKVRAIGARRLRAGARCCSVPVTLLGLLITLAGCGITRTETDYYTITDHDATVHDTTRVKPGSLDDNGVVFPSARSTETYRNTLSHDSTYDRKYPNFLRAGGLETAGLIGSSSTNGLGLGLFGLYSIFDLDQITDSVHANIWNSNRNTQNAQPSLFKGELLRVAPFEFRLRWFGDAPNWTLGWSAAELLAPDEFGGHWLSSVGLNLYLRHRTWIRDRIPYVIFAPYVGVSAFPSAYINLGGELQLGSIAGMSLRAYAGFAAGFHHVYADTGLIAFPYIGLGVSVMDFTNRAEETEREWRDYVHTGINVNIFEASLLKLSQNYESFFDTSLAAAPFQGLQIKLASIEVPLPFANYHFWAGTSLLNYMPLGFFQQGLGILPLRIGYRQYIFAEDLMFEPFFELNYYPSSFINLGARLKLDTYTGENIGITAGYASGSPGNFTPQAFNSGGVQSALSFNTAYFGVTIFLGDWNHSPEQVRAQHKTEH
jgi:hypothetical protein